MAKACIYNCPLSSQISDANKKKNNLVTPRWGCFSNQNYAISVDSIPLQTKYERVFKVTLHGTIRNDDF